MKRLRLLATVLLVVLVVTSCGPPTPTAVPEALTATKKPEPTSPSPTAPPEEEPSTMVLIPENYPTTLDPISAGESDADLVGMSMYNTLMQVNPLTGELEPELAESYKWSEDGLAITFNLRKGVKFHDGSELTAADVKYTVDRMLALKVGVYSILSSLTGAEVVDDYTVVINLNAPFPALLMALSRLYIVNGDLVKENERGGDWGVTWLVDHEAGSGPYYWSSSKVQEEFVLERFPDYFKGWQGKHVDRAIFRIIKEDASKQLALQAGEADWALMFDAENWQALSQVPGILAESHPTQNVLYIVVNNQNQYLKDVRIRKALSYVYDYQGHVKSIALGQAEVARGPMPSDVPCFDDSIPPMETNLDKAKELLAEAGYPNGGLEFEMLVDNNPREVATGELMAAQAAKVGITIKPIAMEWTARIDIWSDQATAPGMGTEYIYAAYADPHQSLYPLLHSSAAGSGGYNFGWYQNTQMDQLLDAGRAELDPVKRCELYKQAQQLFMEDMAYIPVIVEKGLTATRDYVKGPHWAPAHSFVISLYDTYLEGK
jgi:peptide/nickel transport system substrate-binding protein